MAYLCIKLIFFLFPLVAQDDIKPFETILSEEAYAAVLHPEKNGTNCYHCLKRFKNAIGSKVCANVAFCW